MNMLASQPHSYGSTIDEANVTLLAIPKSELQVPVLRFGVPGARPKAYLQAGLHADEFPGVLVLRLLAEFLNERAARGDILGEIIIVPSCNPIGLAQQQGGFVVGRVDRATGQNFNRGFPDLARLVASDLKGSLGTDAQSNVAAIRAAMGRALADITPANSMQAMQLELMKLAHDADIVLDLHADNEALLHLYTMPSLWPNAEDLAAEIDARAVLLCEDSGGAPFDEACGAAWARLAAEFPDAPIPPACLSATVELRSNDSVNARDADIDARALLRFLVRRGFVRGEPGGLPRLLSDATPLTAMEQIKSPIHGLIVYRPRLGDTVRAGEVIAEIVPPTGESVAVTCTTDGLLFARHNQPWAWPGKIIGKVAGRIPLPERTGDLLTP